MTNVIFCLCQVVNKMATSCLFKTNDSPQSMDRQSPASRACRFWPLQYLDFSMEMKFSFRSCCRPSLLWSFHLHALCQLFKQCIQQGKVRSSNTFSAAYNSLCTQLQILAQDVLSNEKRKKKITITCKSFVPQNSRRKGHDGGGGLKCPDYETRSWRRRKGVCMRW